MVGTASDAYPYSFAEAGGQIHGFSVDLLDAVARTMNLRIQRVVGTNREMQARFARGEFDCLQVLTRSPERATEAAFSVPYLTLQGCVFVRKDGRVRTYADLNGKSFAIIGQGSLGEEFLRDLHIAAPIYYATSAKEALSRVESGASAGTFISQLTALSVIDRDHIAGLFSLGQPMPGYALQYCYPVHRGDAALLATLNEGLAIVFHNGQYDAIYDRWFGRIAIRPITRHDLISYTLAALGAALIAAVAGIFWQRSLRKRIARQATELAGQRSLLHALYDHIPVGMSVIELTQDGPRLISLNREAGRLYGLSAAEAVGRPLADLTPSPGVREHLSDALRQHPQGDRIVHYEFQLEKEHRVLEVTLVPVSAGRGNLPCFCVLAEDISARKLMDAEIAQSRKLRAVGELVGGIAHEFNNLLTPMMLKIGEIQMDWCNDPKLQDEISVIAQAAQSAAELTRRLLTFGRKPESGSEPVRLADVIARCFDLLRPAVDRRIVWDSDVPEGLPPLSFNATELNQILINLLLNARDTLLEKLALPHEDAWVPHVRLSVTALPPEAAPPPKPQPGLAFLGWQRLTVQDNGLGMPPNVVERIFEPFFTTKEVGKGTGLGLATVWHLATEAGGKVEAQSSPGAGSTFQVWLPVWPGARPAGRARGRAPPPRAPHAPGHRGGGEPLVAQTVMAILRRGGHNVHHLPDGAEAWRHLASDIGRYDLLVVDVNLPGMSGIDLVSRVRERKYPGRILVVSGRLGIGHLRSLVQMNVDRVLTKPFTARQFETALQDCMAERRN